MAIARFIAGDWGTSKLRLFLCDEHGNTLDTLDGPGVARINGAFEPVFDQLLADWNASHGLLPVVLSGMVGSTVGWRQASYISCPAQPAQIIDSCVALLHGRVHIVPGLRCRNRLDAADFMRGEETQILGALRLHPSLARGRRLLCLPGTHTKWVALADGTVEGFLTAPAGEVFALLREHSVLVRDNGPDDDDIAQSAFADGLQRAFDHPQAPILHLLFECRSRMLDANPSGPRAASFLSGLLIASDVIGAVSLFSDVLNLQSGHGAAGAVYVIGAPALNRAYAAALARAGLGTHSIDGADAALAGLTSVHHALTSGALPHEN